MSRKAPGMPAPRRIPREELQDGLSKSKRERYARTQARKPAYKPLSDDGFINTQHPYHEMHRDTWWDTPREGIGDFRPVRKSKSRAGENKQIATPDTIDPDTNDYHIAHRTRRNGLAEFKPYVWRDPHRLRPAWTLRGLDFAAMAAADMEITPPVGRARNADNERKLAQHHAEVLRRVLTEQPRPPAPRKVRPADAAQLTVRKINPADLARLRGAA